MPKTWYFKQTPHNHLKGQGRTVCSIIKSSNKRKSTTNEFIEKSNIIHNNKYNYSNNIELLYYANYKYDCPYEVIADKGKLLKIIKKILYI